VKEKGKYKHFTGGRRFQNRESVFGREKSERTSMESQRDRKEERRLGLFLRAKRCGVQKETRTRIFIGETKVYSRNTSKRGTRKRDEGGIFHLSQKNPGKT